MQAKSLISSHSNELDKLRAANESLQAKLVLSLEANERLQKENENLRAKLAAQAFELKNIKRLLFGAKSERFEPDSPVGATPSLFPEEEEPEVPAPQLITVSRRVPAPKRRPSRQLLPAHLPREVIAIEPEGDLSLLKKIGVDVTETLEYTPGTLKVIRRERPKYVDPRKENGGIVIADLPARLIDKSILWIVGACAGCEIHRPQSDIPATGAFFA